MPGATERHVRPREEVEGAELLDVAAQVGEPPDELRIRQVPPLGGLAHRQVVEDEELGHLALPRREPQPLAEAGHELLPPDRVISAHALAGVVEEHPEEERERVLEVRDQPAELGLDVHQVAGAQRIEAPERAQGVNVHRVHVVQVVLVVRGDASELGHQRSQHSEGVHLIEDRASPGG